MKEPEYLRLKKQIQADYQHKLQALETIWNLANRSEHGTRNGATTSRRGDLQRAVREATEALGGELTVLRVEGWLQATYPDLAKGLSRSSISQALKRLTEAGELRLLQEGKGKRGATYQRA